VRIIYEKVHTNAKDPVRTYEADACFDLFSTVQRTLMPLETAVIGTGLVFDIPAGYCIQVYSRSGLAAKYGVHVLNAPGVVDANYTGEVSVILHNSNKSDSFRVDIGTKIAQFKLVRLEKYSLFEGCVDRNTPRGASGFGSSG
jgi:dUTP pyrophosphatase